MKRFGSFFFLTCLLLLEPAHGKLLDEGWTSARALGMGNAYTAVVRNSDALFYNPASLARISGLNWTIADPKVGVSGLEVFKTISDASSSDSYFETLQELYGDNVWAGVGVKSAITLPYFGFAVYDNIDASLLLNNPAYTTLDANVVNDFGYVLGFAMPFIPPFVTLGLAAKRITRTGSRVPLGPSFIGTLDPDTLQNELMKKGTGYGLDMGLNFNIDAPFLKPTVSFVWKNVGTTSFRADGSSDAPTGDRDEMILAMSAELSVPFVSVIPSIDIRAINNPDYQMGQKINMGLEVGLPLIDLRTGLHQGYFSYGVGVSLGPLQVDFASFGAELGEYPGQKEDRRYMLQITLELGFDPSVSIFGGGGGKSGSGGSGGGGGGNRLKQRR